MVCLDTIVKCFEIQYITLDVLLFGTCLLCETKYRFPNVEIMLLLFLLKGPSRRFIKKPIIAAVEGYAVAGGRTFQVAMKVSPHKITGTARAQNFMNTPS